MTPDFTVGVHLYLPLLFGGGQNAMGRLKSALLVIFFRGIDIRVAAGHTDKLRLIISVLSGCMAAG